MSGVWDAVTGKSARKAAQVNEDAREEASAQAATARRQTQTSNEDAARAKQKAERGSSRSRGRDMLVGSMSAGLKKSVGG